MTKQIFSLDVVATALTTAILITLSVSCLAALDPFTSVEQNPFKFGHRS